MAVQNLLQKVLLSIITIAYYGSVASAQKTVRFDLFVKDTTVNFTGKEVLAIAINGTIPGPVLEFTEGDSAVIYVHNQLKKHTTSIHWHGLLLPNQYDGVPYLTTAPIQVGETHLYTFRIRQNGTYWYHSHTSLQEQSGMYGALIIHKKKESKMKEIPVVLSDWTNENPNQVHRRLHNATDWYAIKKGSTQNWYQAIKEGYSKTKFKNEWKRMNAMDVSDVYYEKFLINGKENNFEPKYKAGDKIKLRIVNAGSSTYFWINWAGGKMTVVGNDGEDVEPVEVDRLLIAVAETYDVVVTIPNDSVRYEFRATSEDRTKFASLFLGKGIGLLANKQERLKYFEGMKMMNGMMRYDGTMDDMGMKMSNQKMDMNTVMYPEITGDAKHKMKMNDTMDGMTMYDNSTADLITLNYAMLKATNKTILPQLPSRVLRFNLTGNMNRYVWSMNNKVVSEVDKILIKKGENIKIVLYNGTMMRHPMHLHGHFFRLLNGQGDYAPLKNVLDIMPMETDTIEFEANETNDWFFHCHILYHMMSGMGRIFSYENSPTNPEITNPKKFQRKLFADDRRLHLMANIGLESNGSDGEAMLANTRYKLQTEWRLGINAHHGWESESHFGRYFGRNQFLFPYIGWDYRYSTSESIDNNLVGQTNNINNRKAICIGVQYTMPLLIVADIRFDQLAKFRLQLMREDVPISSRLRFSFMANSDYEYMAGFRYIINKWFSLSTHYDSDMGLGAGIRLNY
ncbi:MAG: multicopper oxidase domain-containing protein [Bacteroidetes bacterium]|nr:multicopper oxidase domain-containing protein [Bacteroidota bacterium]